MSITQYEQKIKALNPTEFEELINEIISREYGKNNNFNINHTGKKTGKVVPRKNTPDIWFSFSEGGKEIYCFVEVTTQEKDLFGEAGKIFRDLKKCKNKIENGKLQVKKIIYAFTSAITAEQNKEYSDFCISFGCEFECWGIHKIIYLLKNKYFGLAKEYLGISPLSGNVIELKNAIKSDKYIVTEKNKFLHRENDKNTLIEKLLLNKVVVLSGPSGCGKTRLAIETALELDNNDFDAYWVKPVDSNISAEILAISSINKKSVIIIDDANRMPFILNTLNCVESLKNVYVILTVRDYALKNFIEKNHQNNFSPISLKPLSDDNIRDIIKQSFGINNSDGLNYILDVSKGNLRFAIMTAEVLIKKSKKAQSLAEVIKYYYEGVHDDIDLDKYPKMDNFLVAVSFFKNIIISNAEFIKTICNVFNVDAERFNEYCLVADEKELINYCIDNDYIEIVDQIFADYLCYKLIILENKIKLIDLFVAFYHNYTGKFTDLVQSLLNIYPDDKKLIRSLDEINEYVIENFSCNDAIDFYCYFNKLFPKSCFKITKKVLSDYNGEFIKYNDYDNSIYNKSIRLLCEFHEDKDYYEEAVDILINLLIEKNQLRDVLIHNIEQFFKVCKTTFINKYCVQIKLLKCGLQINKDTGDHHDFLFALFKMYYTYISETAEAKKSSVVFYKIRYIITPEYKEFRRLLWELISFLVNIEDKLELVSIFYKNAFFSKDDYELRCIDKEYALQLLKKIPDNTMLEKVLRFAIISPYSKMDDIKLVIKNMTVTKCMSLYVNYISEIASRHIYDDKFDEDVKKDLCGYENAHELIQDIGLLESVSSKNNVWIVTKIIDIAFDLIAEKYENQYDDLVFEYITQNPEANCQPINILKKIKNKETMLTFLEKSNAKCRYTWITQLYLSLKYDDINEILYLKAKAFFTDNKFFDNNIHWGNETLLNLQNFERYKKGFMHYVLKYCFENKKIVPFFLDTLFFEYAFINKLLTLFDNDVNLLGNIYLKLLERNSTIDYEGNFAKYFIGKNELFLENIINCVFSNNNDYFNLKNLYEQPNFSNAVVNYFYKNKFSYNYRVSKAIKDMPDTLYNEIIEKYVKEKINDEDKLYELTSAINDRGSKGQVLLLDCLIRNDVKVDIIKKLYIFNGPQIWSGSIIPYLIDNLNVLSDYIKNHTKIKNEYKSYLNELKKSLEDTIQTAKVTESIRGRFIE